MSPETWLPQLQDALAPLMAYGDVVGPQALDFGHQRLFELPHWV